jgi:phosphoglycerate dehydrogenase-like enzyme
MQPHMGGITDVAWNRAYKEALENVRAFFETGKAISPVNEADVKMYTGTNGATTNGSSEVR